MDLHKRLKDRRVELGLKVPEVAQRAGIAPTTLYDLERGTQKETPKLHKLAKALQVHLEWLDTGRGPKLLTDAAQSGAQEQRHTYHQRYTLSEDAAQVGWEWQKFADLDAGQAAMLKEMIELLVAARVRAKRAGQRKLSHSETRSSA